jgi:putative two-component system response regulator
MTSTGMKNILIVDDEELNRELLGAVIETLGHSSLFACDGAEALKSLSPHLDLLLVDGMMPGMDGFTLVEKIRQSPEYALVPIIMVTALSGRADRLRAIEAGANDFISKPVDSVELRARIGSLLKMKEAQDALRHYQEELEHIITERTSALTRALADIAAAKQHTYEAHLDTIQRLAMAAEQRDDQTARHIERVSHYCGLLAWSLDLPSEEIEIIRQGSRMHDVGKIGIPDSILLKDTHLTPGERLVMQEHTVIGASILSGSASPLLQAGAEIAISHHERWDGTGYPHGLSENNIPLYGRICAVADVFDALTSRRPYKEAYSLPQACAMMSDACGTHFDPHIFSLFLTNFPVFKVIWRQYKDPS